ELRAIGLLPLRDLGEEGRGLARPRRHLLAAEGRDRDRGQDADDQHDDHQRDEGEAFFFPRLLHAVPRSAHATTAHARTGHTIPPWANVRPQSPTSGSYLARR